MIECRNLLSVRFARWIESARRNRRKISFPRDIAISFGTSFSARRMSRSENNRVPAKIGDKGATSPPQHGKKAEAAPGCNGHFGGVKSKFCALNGKRAYGKELRRLQVELVKFQEWVRSRGLKVVCLFEGRDAAGKGGAIKRISECLNPRVCRIVALPTPTEKEKTQWYFQRYVAHLPSAGEIVLFDRSWYNRAGVERVMGFCTESEYLEFMHSCPEFERMLIRSGITLVKYWFSVSHDEQERRFQARMKDPTKRWKLSPMDLESRRRWVDYSRAKDEMFSYTDIKQSPWYVVQADDKKCARLNCIRHLLSLIP